MKDIATIIITILILLANLNVMFLCLPPKKSLRYIIFAYIILTIAIIIVDFTIDHLGIINIHAFRIIYSVLFYFPFIVLFFRESFFQKLFAFFLSLASTTTVLSLIRIPASLFFPNTSFEFWLTMLVMSVVLYAVHIVIARKFGRRLFDRLFAYGNTKEWGLYSLSMGICFLIVEVNYPFIDRYLTMSLVPLVVVWWNIVILCYAIISTHEKTKQKYEADFARDIITSGRDHYQKMNEQYDALRILKHDYKFHLSTALDMLRRGEIDKSDEYLRGLELQLSERELPAFCDNPVINSLIADYARQCKELKITMDASISIPSGFPVLNYEMCIVLGNLLENALEAVKKLKTGRKIELAIKTQGKQLALMVRNTFDGLITTDGEQLISTKKDGGIGLQSVKAVTNRYCESFFTEYDAAQFTAFVLWKETKTV